MENPTEREKLAEMDLSEKGVKTRKALLTTTAIVWFVVLTGALPEQIGFASITFSAAERTGMLAFLVLVLCYFLVSFYFESDPKWKEWKRRKASGRYQESVRLENEYLRKEAPEEIRHLRKDIDKAVEGAPSPWDDNGKTEGYDRTMLTFVEQQEDRVDRYEKALATKAPHILRERKRQLKYSGQLWSQRPWWYDIKTWFELRLPIWLASAAVVTLIYRWYSGAFTK